MSLGLSVQDEVVAPIWKAADSSTNAGGVGWGVFGSYARYTGVLNCLFCLLAFFVGQGAYLGSEYWLITWAYR